jgi:hypothetical protein
MTIKPHEKSGMPLLAIVNRPTFEKRDERGRRLGKVLEWDVYPTTHRRILAAADRRGQLFLVTVRPVSGKERLWLIAYYPEIRKVSDGIESTETNSMPITDITHLRSRLKFDNGIGVKRTPALLRHSLRSPRILTPGDIDLLVEALRRRKPHWKGLKRLIARQRAANPDFDPKKTGEERRKIFAAINQRRGQPEFRKKLLNFYGGKCIFTGCDAKEALEAAHIQPYRGKYTNHPQNGLLLRADVHTLFDLGLITVDTSNMSLILEPSLKTTKYRKLHGKHLNIPKDCPDSPSKEALAEHRKRSELRSKQNYATAKGRQRSRPAAPAAKPPDTQPSHLMD